MVRTSRSPVSRRWLPPLRIAAAVALLAFAGAIAFVGAIVGSDRLRSTLMERSGATNTRDVVLAVVRAPLRRFRAETAGNAIDRLTLDVKFKHIHSIHDQRDRARRMGVLTTSDADLVPGSLEVDGRTARVRFRLAGNRVDLLEDEKWPLYFRTRGDDHVFGMRSFEFRSPTAYGPNFAHLLLPQLAREDIVAPRYGLVDFTMNGKAIGLLAFEEVPAAELLARQKRRDGPILRFDSMPRFGAEAGATAIAPLRPDHIADSKSLSRSASVAERLLQDHLRGSLAAADVFDTELLGRYLATIELWGANSALHWRNLRFYFNPMTALLEPVASVGALHGSGGRGADTTDATRFAKRWLADSRIASAYTSARSRIAVEIRTKEFGERLRTTDANWLRSLHREFPLRLPFDPATYFERSGANPWPQGERAGTRPPRSARESIAEFDLPLPHSSLDQALAQHSFLSWDEQRRELRAAAGRWDVEGSLVVPDDIGLTLPAGTTLRFEARHGLIARGPLRFLGRADAPVVLEGPSARQRSKLWAGVYVVEAARPSHWSHVIVRNTGGFKRRGFTLAGGVVFRKAAVVLENCTFSGDRTDDALNVVRTHFELTDVEIVDAELDAFDADYSEGSITRGSISRAGGDGVDLGGTHATIRGTHFSNVRDKAISVGEASRLTATGLEIERVGIGVASKNGSTAEISDSNLSDVSDVALVVYMNRPEFGPGALWAADNRISRTALPALAQTGSRLELDGSLIRPIDVAINRLYKDRSSDSK